MGSVESRLEQLDVLLPAPLGTDLTLEEGYEAARLTGLAILASLTRELGDLVPPGNFQLVKVHCTDPLRHAIEWATSSARRASGRTQQSSTASATSS